MTKQNRHLFVLIIWAYCSNLAIKNFLWTRLGIFYFVFLNCSFVTSRL